MFKKGEVGGREIRICVLRIKDFQFGEEKVQGGIKFFVGYLEVIYVVLLFLKDGGLLMVERLNESKGKFFSGWNYLKMGCFLRQ